MEQKETQERKISGSTIEPDGNSVIVFTTESKEKDMENMSGL